MKNFAITGVAGYIAPRHLKAIKDTGNNLLAAVDPHDSAGLLDSCFPNASFFTEFERFERHLEKLRRSGKENGINYLSICSPNNLHDAHVRLALRLGADAICEKPLVLNPWNLEALQELEKEYGKKVYTVLQLRNLPSIISLKEKIKKNGSRKHTVVLTYITSRGLWYKYSWKGDAVRSGGIATNIGIHLFDLLIWLFGSVETSIVHMARPDKMSGFLSLKDPDTADGIPVTTEVKWFLSIDRNDLPASVIEKNSTTYRSILVDGNELEFTDGFTDIHTKVYENIINGKGFGIKDAMPAVEVVYDIRNAKISEDLYLIHPLMEKKYSLYPV